MKVIAAKDVPCVSQSSIWKGYFEAHFMSGKEIDAKYPILNKVWIYSKLKQWTKLDKYDGYYFTDEKNIDDNLMSDPWFREFKDDIPINESVISKMYHTTVESNAVLLVVYKK